MIKRRILSLDGNYFAQRLLGGLNMGESTNFLETPNEKKAFSAGLNSSLISLYSIFEPYVDNIIFCPDNHSWRKTIEPIRPYYLDKSVLIGYKEQRKEKKEESPINYDNFYSLYRDFVESIKTKIPVFDIPGLEADDTLMLLSNKLNNYPDVEMITFCTDGDLMQIVKNNSILFRNIKSGDAPNGEFVLNHKKYCDIFEQSAITQLLGSSENYSFYKKLFTITLNNQSSVERSLHRGINIATPFKVALVKSICGDKKDNLFPIFRWKSTTGTTDFKVTEKHLTKALDCHKLKLTESTCQQILTDKDYLSTLIFTLRQVCKQEHVDLKEIGKHLKHNLHMNVLSVSNVPEQYLADFDNMWNGYEKELLTGKFDSTILKTLNVAVKDKAINLMESSIPTITID